MRGMIQRSMSPVWEANHVWLIFVLVIAWTAYPDAFGSIASTLAAPLFIAAIGIIMRGTAYALRSGTVSAREQRAAETARRFNLEIAGVIENMSGFTTPGGERFTIFGEGGGGLMAKESHPGEVGQWINGVYEVVGPFDKATADWVYPKPNWPGQ